jgi:integrase
MSGRGLGKMCAPYRIPVPPRGWWAKKQHGHRIRQTPLPDITVKEQIVFEPKDPIEKQEDPPEIAREKTAEWRIEVREDLAITHPLVKRAAAAIRKTRGDKRDFVRWQDRYQAKLAKPGPGNLDIAVSKGSLSRALRIMQALLAALKRMFNLAIQAGKLIQKPHIPFLKEHNVRVGFFERDQFVAVVQRLPKAVRPPATFAYLTGWRIDSEVLSLEWRQVDFNAGEVRLDPGRTKNGEGRTFPMTRELRQLLEAQRAITDDLQRRHNVVCRHVFHRDGRPIRSFRVAFRTACVRAGCPGRVLHDLRRTAVRNLVRAGIPERVAMQMTGHKTRSVFERYNIVSAGDLRDAGRRLDIAAGTISGTIGQNQRAGTKTGNPQVLVRQ